MSTREASSLPLEAGLCDHCHLPLPRSWSVRRLNADAFRDTGPVYCCFGCRLSADLALERAEEGSARRTLTRLGLAIFFTMNVMAFSMALWTADVYQGGGVDDATARLAASFYGLFRSLVLIFALPVLGLLGLPLWENAWESLKRGIFSTDLLLAAGVLASFGYSVLAVIRGYGPIYFEVGCVVLVMTTLGRWLEATGKLRANDALDRLTRLMPEQVRRIRDGIEETISLDAVARGDFIRVLAGERIPADGRVFTGMAFVDEQVLTGESRPAHRVPGNLVLGGTLNLDGDLLVEVTAPGAAGALARLIDLVRSARLIKGDYERLADQVSAWFVPVVSLIAVATLIGQSWISGIEHGLLQSLAVVLIACPCALGLATPLAVWSALGHAASAQVLFRGGEALERLAKVRAVRFDKTGTLTTGDPTISSFFTDDSPREEVIDRAGALASSSTHVLANGIRRFTDAMRAGPLAATHEVRVFAGQGVIGVIPVSGSHEPTLLGSRAFLESKGLQTGARLHEQACRAEEGGKSLSWVGWDGRARGLFVFDEQLRPSAVRAIEECRGLGIDVGVLTGDHRARGSALAQELNVNVESMMMPEAKVQAIDHARRTFGPVAMVGDGVNDAPALASSDVGVALACGTDLSRDSAAVCLLGDDLSKLPWAIALARQTVKVIRENLAWAFGYNTIGVAAAAFGKLNPALAAFLMVGSSAFVIMNSLRLRAPDSSIATAPASVVAEAAAS